LTPADEKNPIDERRSNDGYEFGPFRVDKVKRRLLRDGQIVPLTPKAFDTLLVLIEHAGQLVEKTNDGESMARRRRRRKQSHAKHFRSAQGSR